jgi:hypothetical protein
MIRYTGKVGAQYPPVTVVAWCSWPSPGLSKRSLGNVSIAGVVYATPATSHINASIAKHPHLRYNASKRTLFEVTSKCLPNDHRSW